MGGVNTCFSIKGVKVEECSSERYLLEVPDAVVAAEALLLTVHQQEVVRRRAVGQVVAALLAAVHDQPIGPAVHVETCVAADLVSHRLEAHLVTNLQRGEVRWSGEERRAIKTGNEGEHT